MNVCLNPFIPDLEQLVSRLMMCGLFVELRLEKVQAALW